MNKKIGIVTGSSKGIGKAIAIAFAKSGEYFAVVTNARKLLEAQAVSDEIRAMGCNSIPIEADISTETHCVRVIEETIKNYNRIDVLVNNAGVQEDVPLEETTMDLWQKILAVDLTGP